MSTFDSILEARRLDKECSGGTQMPDFCEVIQNLTAATDPAGVADELTSVIVPLHERIDRLVIDLSIQDATHSLKVELYEKLGNEFAGATRFGWKLTTASGEQVESRCVNLKVAKTEARRIDDLFAEKSPGVDYECVVLDHQAGSEASAVVSRFKPETEGEGRS